MKTVYPVLFTKTESNILVEVPDLEILTEGTDMNHAIDMARDAIELKCVSMEDAKEDVPKPSEFLDIDKATFAEEGKTIVSFVDANPDEYRRKIDTIFAAIAARGLHVIHAIIGGVGIVDRVGVGLRVVDGAMNVDHQLRVRLNDASVLKEPHAVDGRHPVGIGIVEFPGGHHPAGWPCSHLQR